MDYESDCSSEPFSEIESESDAASTEQIESDQQRSEAYLWARAWEAAFIGGNYAEAARLAGERNLLTKQGESV